MKLCRSPRTALWLVLAVTVYSLLATFIPQGGALTPDAIAWTRAHPSAAAWVLRLGLFRAFATPVFLALVAALTLSTGVCAWSRTRVAFSRWRARGTVTDSLARRLRERPDLAVSGEVASLKRAAAAMRVLRLDVRTGPKVVEGVSGRIGLLGSPVFHWALVVLFVAVALGQLTRSEGQIGIAVGGSRPEIASSYGTLSTGALFLGHSGLTLSVPRIQKKNIIEGIDREPAPEVVLSDGDRVLEDQLVYPNNPLRHGAFTIHRGPFGFSLPVSVETSSGQVVGSLDLLIDMSDDTDAGTAPQSVDLNAGNRSIAVTLTLVPTRSSTGVVLLQTPPSMVVRLESSMSSAPTTITAPGSVQLPDGLRLNLGSVSNYARIGVVHDWSVWWIYSMLTLATLGLMLTMLVPHRVVWAMLVADEDGTRVHVVVENARRDPLFAARVADVFAAEVAGTDAGTGTRSDTPIPTRDEASLHR